MSDLTFADLKLAEPLLRAVAETGYTTPTPIQAQAIPQVILGGDLLAAAQTGTGKTAGFTLPILQRLIEKGAPSSEKGTPRVLILTPTRELAAQVEESVQTYGKYLPYTSMVMFGGVNIKPQHRRLHSPLDILVATPGRLLDHVGQQTVDLSAVEILVLDEADRMLDMGFIHDIKKILKIVPAERQNLLFSATFSDEIKDLADKLLNNPALIEVARRNTTNELVSQRVHLVDRDKKLPLLTHLIKEGDWHQVLVFMRTKHACNRVAEKLNKDGITAMAIHGNKSQNARTAALAQFKTGELQVLVATDIAARGLDIEELPHVVNFELPNISEDYVHRIGRTGRAGCTGEALSLVCVDELKFLADIEKLTKQSIPQFTVPGFEADLSVKPEPIVRGGLGRDRPPRTPRANTNSRPPKGWNKANAEALQAEKDAMLAAGASPEEVAKVMAAKKAEAESKAQRSPRSGQGRRRNDERAEGSADTAEIAALSADGEAPQARAPRQPREGQQRGRGRRPAGEARVDSEQPSRAPRQERAPRDGAPRQERGPRNDERRGPRGSAGEGRGNEQRRARPDSRDDGRAPQRAPRERMDYDERQPMSNANALPAELMQRPNRGPRYNNGNTASTQGGFPPIPRQGGYYDKPENGGRGGSRSDGRGPRPAGRDGGRTDNRGARPAARDGRSFATDAKRNDQRKPQVHTSHSEGHGGQRRRSAPTAALLGGGKPRDEE
ncbi:DEAD/DEAH box helicase [Chitinibacter fontanus]|uniref:DEAD/DEAH box helicase n=1 Tax=Chitinibacter fontanus TaxID=1737446 RepID=UPI001D14AD6F|nr:DEAD/DEAH box helicase [Chitinibacter fontanus]